MEQEEYTEEQIEMLESHYTYEEIMMHYWMTEGYEF